MPRTPWNPCSSGRQRSATVGLGETPVSGALPGVASDGLAVGDRAASMAFSSFASISVARRCRSRRSRAAWPQRASWSRRPLSGAGLDRVELGLRAAFDSVSLAICSSFDLSALASASSALIDSVRVFSRPGSLPGSSMLASARVLRAHVGGSVFVLRLEQRPVRAGSLTRSTELDFQNGGDSLAALDVRHLAVGDVGKARACRACARRRKATVSPACAPLLYRRSPTMAFCDSSEAGVLDLCRSGAPASAGPCLRRGRCSPGGRCIGASSAWRRGRSPDSSSARSHPADGRS